MSLQRRRWLDRLVWLPTAVHLWATERELAAVADPGWARRRTRALLRRYRRASQFPQNTVAARAAVPVFVDDAGRRCAVAHLMERTGGAATAGRLAVAANLAALADMRDPGLDAWVRASGLTHAELARVQPRYPPSPAEMEHLIPYLWAMVVVGGLAANSLIFNLGRLTVGWSRRATAVLGLAAGPVLVGLALMAPSPGYHHRTGFAADAMAAVNGGLVVGLAATVAGWAAWRRRATARGPAYNT